MAGISPLHLTSAFVVALWLCCTLKAVSYIMQYSMTQCIISPWHKLLQDVMNINYFNRFHKLSGKFMEEQAAESYQAQRWRLWKRKPLKPQMTRQSGWLLHMLLGFLITICPRIYCWLWFYARYWTRKTFISIKISFWCYLTSNIW